MLLLLQKKKPTKSPILFILSHCTMKSKWIHYYNRVHSINNNEKVNKCHFSKKRFYKQCVYLSLNSIFTKREVSFLLLLTKSLLGLFKGSQSSTHSTGLLDTKVQRNILLLVVEESELFTLSLVDDSQDTSNILTGFTTNQNIQYFFLLF